MKLQQSSQESPQRNIRLVLEYDGSNYVGWQRQINGISIQEKVEEALAVQLGTPVRVTAAGRTDAGVHALGQVVNFHTSSELTPRAIHRGAIRHLPRDITIVAADEVPVTFNARRDARLRWYRFHILNRSIAPAVGANFLTHVPFPLNPDKMGEAAARFEGHHDFSAFRAVTCTAVRTDLTMQRPGIRLLPDGLIIMDFRCRSFLQNMVRIMAGTIVACGRGRLAATEISEMLKTGKRRNEAVTLPPNGLFLYRVHYTGED
ncbi:MAG: tRNA pseudouridine(38-40) synthase TruA [Candidatus Sumerlaeaceae bacterium]|nr:tRNA pseudouridine(38-40) synthase TruA [Candidatus Sumerlaeaceae bacterium]